MEGLVGLDQLSGGGSSGGGSREESRQSMTSPRSRSGTSRSKSRLGSKKFSRTRRYTQPDILPPKATVLKETELAPNNPHRDPYHITAQEWEALRYSLIENHLETFHLYELRNLSASSVRNMWNKYDKRQKGELHRYAIMNFAKNCVEKLIAQAENDLKQKKPKLKELAIKHQVEEQLPRILPGMPSSPKEGTEHMWFLVAHTFDPFGLGCIRRENFLKSWQEFAETCLFRKGENTNPLRVCTIL